MAVLVGEVSGTRQGALRNGETQKGKEGYNGELFIHTTWFMRHGDLLNRVGVLRGLACGGCEFFL